MTQEIQSLLSDLNENKTQFSEVIAFIESNYQHQPTAFKNGDAYNEASQNQGSAKVFSFAKLNNLNKEETLSLFAEYYQAVLSNPEGTDHQNIRQFMIHGWDEIKFEGEALVLK